MGKKGKADQHVSSYSSPVAYCFGVNVMVGVGVLSLPHAFYNGGFLSCLFFLAIVSVFLVITMNWDIEAIARARDYDAWKQQQDKKKKKLGIKEQSFLSKIKSFFSKNKKKSVDDYGDGNEAEKLVQPVEQEKPVAIDEPKIDPKFEITFVKYEMNKLINLYVGVVGKVIYEIAVSCYLFGALWSYGSTFAQSMASHIPLPIGWIDSFFTQKSTSDLWYTCDIYNNFSLTCTIEYWIYLGVFGMIVIPLSLMSLTEQKAVQIFLAVFRFFAIFVMIGLALISMWADPYSKYSVEDYNKLHPVIPTQKPFIGELGFEQFFNWRGLPEVIPLCIFSQIFHGCIAELVQPVKDKKYVNFTFSTIFITTFSFYSLLGITLGLYYGKGIKPACSLNFAYYRGGASFEEEVPFYAIFVQYLIVLFPAFDVVSAFPLNAITLADSLYAAVFPHTKLEEEEEEDSDDGEVIDEERAISEKSNKIEEDEERKSILGAEKQAEPEEGHDVTQSTKLYQSVDDDVHEVHEVEEHQTMPDVPSQKKKITVISKKGRKIQQKETSMETIKKLMKEIAKRFTKSGFRLIATIPPLIGAAIIRDLEKILRFVGLFGLVIAVIVPAMLQFFSKRKCQQAFGKYKTRYTYPILSSDVLTIIFFIIGVIALVGLIGLNVVLTVIEFFFPTKTE